MLNMVSMLYYKLSLIKYHWREFFLTTFSEYFIRVQSLDEISQEVHVREHTVHRGTNKDVTNCKMCLVFYRRFRIDYIFILRNLGPKRVKLLTLRTNFQFLATHL